MASPRYISLGEAIALHEFIMRKVGVAPAPLRDEAALEAALMRAQMAAHYEEADLVRQAALIAIGISQAQAFVDGNKRTAYICCDVFLEANGLLYTGPAVELSKQLEAVAERQGSLSDATDRFESWLRGHVEELSPR